MTDRAGPRTGPDSTPRPLGADWLDRFVTLLGVQHDLLAEVDRLSLGQRSLIEAGDGDRLLSVLAAREELLDRVARNNELIEPLRERWERSARELDASTRESVGRRREALAQLGARIAARDDADRALIAQRRDRLADELRGVATARSAVVAYQRPRGGIGTQDRKA